MARGSCPGLARPLATGDGLLARLPAREHELSAWAALCAIAQEHASGELEVTARGSLQLRGVRPGTASALQALGFDDEPAPALLCTPLAGRDPAALLDAHALAARLRDVLSPVDWLGGLHPKVSVALESGGALHLDALVADVRLRPVSASSLAVLLGGDGLAGRSLGRVAAHDAASCARDLLGVLAHRGTRARDVLESEGDGAFRAALGSRLQPGSRPQPRLPVRMLGVHPMHGGRCAVGVGLPFGALDAQTFAALVAAAGERGATSLQPGQRHSVLALDFDAAGARAFQQVAARLGFALRDDEPARQISTCAGQPGCATAHLATRPLASELARAAAALLDGSLRIHLAGCAKRCAAPHDTELQLTATNAGCEVRLAVGARTLRGHWHSHEIAARLADAALAVARERAPHEPARAVLARSRAAHGALALERVPS